MYDLKRYIKAKGSKELVQERDDVIFFDGRNTYEAVIG